MNDIGMLKLKDKILASDSIALTKAQRTRQVQTRITEEEANKLKVVSELHKHMIKQQSKESSKQLNVDFASQADSGQDNDDTAPVYERQVNVSIKSSKINQALLLKEIDQQRKKLEIEILKDNLTNQINRDILVMFEDDLSQPNPVKTFRYENFKSVI